MLTGYAEFEFDLPGALLTNLVHILDSLVAVRLDRAEATTVPDEQGVYQLLLDGIPVYIGKTDAGAGLQKRLVRHSRKILHRKNLDPTAVSFKAIRIFVFTAMDLEADLIRHYGGGKGLAWNGSGFGSNDPGKNRDTTVYKPQHFETQFPIDLDRKLDFSIPLVGKAATILGALKRELPYLLRFERVGRSSRPHPDLEATDVVVSSAADLSPERIIRQVVNQLPTGWHATMLPSHVILYKDDERKFPSGITIAKS